MSERERERVGQRETETNREREREREREIETERQKERERERERFEAWSEGHPWTAVVASAAMAVPNLALGPGMGVRGFA